MNSKQKVSNKNSGSVHQHNHQQQQGKRLIISIILNVIITVTQVIGGLISGSMALLSDALHNFSDVLALVLSYIANRLSGRSPNVKQTFGFKRAEIIAAFINASTLIGIAIYLSFEAFNRFYQPVSIESSWVIIFAGLSILLNGLSVLILHRYASTNMNIRSAYIHLMSDMLTSVAVLIAGILMASYKIYWIDGLLTLLIAIYLVVTTWKILIGSLKVLMLFTPAHIAPEEIRETLINFKEIKNIHHVHLWQLNEGQVHFEAHINFYENLSLEEVNKVLENVRTVLSDKFQINHVTLQPEFNACDDNDLISGSH